MLFNPAARLGKFSKEAADLYAQTRQGMSQVPERGGESRPPLRLLHLAAWHSMTRSTHRAWLVWMFAAGAARTYTERKWGGSDEGLTSMAVGDGGGAGMRAARNGTSFVRGGV